MDLKKEKSCGCIIINDNKVLLVYEKYGKFWGFPKGHVEDGETEIETAKREVYEEVGLEVLIDESKRFMLNYVIDNKIDKTVVLYLATLKSENIKMQESEISNVKWCTFEEAINMLTYNDWKELFKKVITNLN